MNWNQALSDHFKQTLQKLISQEKCELSTLPDVQFSKPAQKIHGDVATNIALVLAKPLKMKPREVADRIVPALAAKADLFAKVEIAGPGFINMWIQPHVLLSVLEDISRENEKYGHSTLGQGKKVQVEFVSANPTGPLHIGHGRGAIYGDVLGNVLAAAGYDVSKEYYVNDVGVQMTTLGRSVYLRLQELQGQKIEFPETCYQGAYIRDIAREVLALDPKIASSSEADAIAFCGKYAGDKILKEIQDDLAATGVIHDVTFFEHELHEHDAVKKVFQKLEKSGHTYEQDGALWFRSTVFGDDKDRVLRKNDGSLTYFAADIAYHEHKYARGFDRIIDIWGADHGGYVARIKAVVQALGYEADSFDAVLIQLVNLIRDGELISMSTRSAQYETLADVRNEVGKDACRYFFLMRSHHAQLDFDLNLAKSESTENPVYYIQYAYARIQSVFRKALEKGLKPPKTCDLTLLNLPEEIDLAVFLSEYRQVVHDAAAGLEPHRIAFYALELALAFQGYYSQAKHDDRYRFLTDDAKATEAKLYLLKNIAIVLHNALTLMGLSAPEEMIKGKEDT
ncbi:MAG: arginine--tRNA ligase [Deltaproteobacteria bacterium]|nr:arginine--tRNA ligase [Deltaproteobacteria bacterium]